MTIKLLYNQHALVTGGSQGIGKAIAKKLTSLGCKVTLLARNEKLLKDNVDFMNRYFPLKEAEHDYIKFDLTRPELIEEDISSKLQTVNILVNCAGLSQRKLLLNTPFSEIQDIINTNLVSPIVLSKLFLKNARRKKLENAHIINISSAVGKSELQHNLVGSSVYTSSKAGLSRFSDVLAAETLQLAQKSGKFVRVTAIHPGHVPETAIGSTVKIDASQHFFPPDSLDSVVEQVVTALIKNQLQ